MFLLNCIKKIWNWGSESTELQESIKTLEEFDEETALAEYDARPKDKIVPNNNVCFERSGIVKFVTETYGLTDKDVYFEYPLMNQVKVGMIINYLAVLKDGVQKIVRVLSFEVEGEWNEEASQEYHAISIRSFPGQVKERRGRIVVVSLETEDQECNLDKIHTEFVPVVGDWVQLDANVEVDEKVSNLAGRILEIFKISPIRVKHGCKGLVRRYDKNTGIGIINQDIRFSKDTCMAGYSPMVNDSVSYEIIESTFDDCTWRALKVSQNKRLEEISTVIKPDSNLSELEANKNGIILSDKNVICLKNIGDRLNITLEVVNNGLKSHKILSYTFKSTDTQLSVRKPSLDQPIVINPKETIIFILHCLAKRMGVTSEFFIINFEGFQIGRWISIQVIPHSEDAFKNSGRKVDTMYKVKRNAAQNHLRQMGKHNFLPGNKVVKSPAFVQNKMKIYDIPSEISDQFFKHIRNHRCSMYIPAQAISKSIAENLSLQNYEDRFHNLLYMEELSIIMALREFDINRTNFIRNDEYLMLEVNNLNERRPSVLIGDRVFAFNPNDPNVERKEGYVHKLGAKHLFLKFAPSFHSTYNGEDYSIEFNVNRSSFRKYHHAVELAMRNLGKRLLFPTSVQKQPKQVDFICPDAEEDSLDKTTPKQSKYIRFSKSPKNQTDESPNKDSKYIRFTQKSPKNTTAKHENEENNMPTKLKLEWYDKSLNKYQKAAVKNILYGESRPLPYLIFGPPGTGKTVTVIETILQILRMIPHSRILVAAPSNSAADLIGLRLLDSGVLAPGDLVRLVAFKVVTDGNIPQNLLPYSVTADISKEGTFKTQMGIQNGVTLRAPISYLGRHRITITTCVTASTLHIMGFPKEHFTHIIVDEAAHSTEPEIMIPLIMFDVKSAQIVLAGKKSVVKSMKDHTHRILGRFNPTFVTTLCTPDHQHFDSQTN